MDFRSVRTSAEMHAKSVSAVRRTYVELTYNTAVLWVRRTDHHVFYCDPPNERRRKSEWKRETLKKSCVKLEDNQNWRNIVLGSLSWQAAKRPQSVS